MKLHRYAVAFSPFCLLKVIAIIYIWKKAIYAVTNRKWAKKTDGFKPDGKFVKSDLIFFNYSILILDKTAIN
jgi:hypothetical protein